ncbi:hypothetical protein [Pseudonocardia sp. HH130630-07]|uniref:hypothetical protein n=1 Tax=Pseudonocardia sp. HH130630-07 TaxID=1690815 RepID=UPI000814C32D|nr:hypothetical protein [Pseudonocardia sp. HH130630-07]ANY05267.1 hypothetical protein AFB00_01875 [Pseudonocardia sp. HH130630-07]
MLRATSSRVGLFRERYEVRLDGRAVTGWTARTWQPHRDLVIDGHPYALRSEGIARFALEGDVRAHILRTVDHPDGPLSRPHWNVEIGDLTYRLSGSGLGRRFALLTTADAVNEAGRVWRSGTLRPSYAAQLPDALDLPVQVFVLWSAMAIWRASVAAAATAART